MHPENTFDPYFENLWKGSITIEDDHLDFIFYFIDWKKNLFKDLRLALQDELYDELISNTNLVPLALLCETDAIDIKDLLNQEDEYERMDVILESSYNYLMYDKITGEIYLSTIGKIAKSIG